MRISVVGAGYVGTVTAAGLAEIGHEVICVDIDEPKVLAINSGETILYEESLDNLVARNAGERLRATLELGPAISATEVTLITVDTPFGGEDIDLSSVKDVAASIGKALRDQADYHVVVVKSTVVPGTTDSVVRPIIEAESGKTAGIDFGLGMNPEFLREGQAVQDFMTPDRIVIGAIDQRTRQTLDEVYRPFTGAEIVYTDTRTAELIKYASNGLLATLISFSNEIANLASELGIDSSDVMRGVHLDRRLSPIMDDGSRLQTGILSYLMPGCGFGGSCFPKDVKALLVAGNNVGKPLSVLDAVMKVNDSQPLRMVELLKRQIPDLLGASVAILGAAFKPGTDDVRESPAIKIAERLLAEGAVVTMVDPVATEQARRVLGDRVTYEVDHHSLDDAVDAFLLVTAWPQFATLPDHVSSRRSQPVVVDGRRFWPKGAFTRYEAIGL